MSEFPPVSTSAPAPAAVPPPGPASTPHPDPLAGRAAAPEFAPAGSSLDPAKRDGCPSDEEVRPKAYANWEKAGRPMFVASETFANWIDAVEDIEHPNHPEPPPPPPSE